MNDAPDSTAMPTLPTSLGNRKIIRRAEARAIFDADEIVMNARREAETIRNSAQQAVEEARQQGYKEGWSQAATAAAKELHQAHEKIKTRFTNLETEIAELAIEAVDKILGSFDDRELAILATREALNEHIGSDTYLLRCSPEQSKHLEQLLNEAIGRSSNRPNIEPDPRLSGEECVLVTSYGAISIDIASQMRALRESMGLPATPTIPKPKSERKPLRPMSDKKEKQSSKKGQKEVVRLQTASTKISAAKKTTAKKTTEKKTIEKKTTIKKTSGRSSKPPARP